MTARTSWIFYKKVNNADQDEFINLLILATKARKNSLRALCLCGIINCQPFTKDESTPVTAYTGIHQREISPLHPISLLLSHITLQICPIHQPPQ